MQLSTFWSTCQIDYRRPNSPHVRRFWWKRWSMPTNCHWILCHRDEFESRSFSLSSYSVTVRTSPHEDTIQDVGRTVALFLPAWTENVGGANISKKCGANNSTECERSRSAGIWPPAALSTETRPGRKSWPSRSFIYQFFRRTNPANTFYSTAWTMYSFKKRNLFTSLSIGTTRVPYSIIFHLIVYSWLFCMTVLFKAAMATD